MHTLGSLKDVPDSLTHPTHSSSRWQTAVIIGNNLLGSSTTSLKRRGGCKGKGGPGTKGTRGGRRRRRRRGPPSTANRDSQQSTPERHDGRATTGVEISGLPPPPVQGQEHQSPPSLQASLPGVSVMVGPPTHAPPASVLLAPAPSPVVGGAAHTHVEAGHPQWRHAPGRRHFYDAQGATTPRRSREVTWTNRDRSIHAALPEAS